MFKPMIDECSEELQVEQAEEDALVEAIVKDVAGGMAAGLVSAKWDCLLNDLAPLIKVDKLEQVAEILQRYWPPDVEIDELVEYSTSDEQARL